MDKAITIVSGLPRSGTSMMMRMLEAGGMEVLTDNERKADEDNPKGYYELEKVKKIKEDSSWLADAQGKAFKMVSMLLYHLPMDRNFNVIFMQRNIDEMLASQKKMLERKGVTGNGPGEDEMRKIYLKHLDEIQVWVKQRKNMAVLYVSFNEVIENSRSNIAAINQFLGNRLDTVKMAESIDISLYRNKA